MKAVPTRVWMLLFCGCFVCGFVMSPAGAAREGGASHADRLNQAGLVLVGEVVEVGQAIAAMSMPPQYNVSFTLGKDTQALRGVVDGKVEVRLHTMDEAMLPKRGDKVIVVADRGEDGAVQSTLLLPATPEHFKLAERATSVPVGWGLVAEGVVCPWSALGAKAWPKALDALVPADQPGSVRCSKTGRPALMLGQGLTLSVEQVIPEKVEQWVNPYGDGTFRVTLTNTTDAPVTTAVLLAQGEAVLWEESLVVIHGGMAKPLSSAKGLPATAKPVTLQPHASISTTVDTLALDGVDWPQGGSRVHFSFALGEQSVGSFFYYFSKHHDKLRDAARAKPGTR